MKELLFKYLQFLIPKYKCVTLPGFGAFILNKNSFSKKSIDALMPPSHSLSFNSKLMHDDGILISFHQKTKKISYEQATKEISACLNGLRGELQSSSNIEFGTLGSMSLVDDKLFFEPSKHYFTPKNFGLTPVMLQALARSSNEKKANTEKISIPKTFSGSKPLALAVAAVAAIVFLISIDSIPDINNEHEQAGFVQTILSPSWLKTPKLNNAFANIVDKEANNNNDYNITDAEEKSSESMSQYFTVDNDILNSLDKVNLLDNSVEINKINSETKSSENEDILPISIETEDFDTPENLNPKHDESNIATIDNLSSSENASTFFYLIVGGSSSEDSANKILQNFKRIGFENASILESPGRFRVHIGKFETKAIADSVSLQFKIEHPRYASAWIYTDVNQ